ncbi:unnamed protein product [Arabis nemorensis]|uniref:Uncharacterized protein n=1 Tax=Arabis nemorensis TaxID=586526 RepID=A0A565BNE1_9BRAS|nr:unnamed protein product [Arabis nemorensis]
MEPRRNYLALRRFFEPSKCRFYPYATGRGGSCKEAMKEELVKLGAELSVYNPVSERLLHVIHYVYSKHIQPKNCVYVEHHCESVQWELIRKDFAEGILVFHRLESILRKKDCSFDDRLLSSAIAKYKQVLKKVEDKLRSAKHVSVANGFAREMVEPKIYGLWKSFFDEEEEAIPEVIRTKILSDLFEPFLNKPKRGEILALSLSSPYILGESFAMQELKEEVVQLGVELSLLVARSMFSLCDNIPSVLHFCFVLYRDVNRDRNLGSAVEDRLLRVIYYVYSKYIKPMNQNAGKSVQRNLISTTLENLVVGFANLNRLVVHVRVCLVLK